MISDWTTMITVPFISRPMISEPRTTGETRKRSRIPLSMSSITAMPLQPAEKSADITTIPGVRNWMYEVEWKPGMRVTLLNSAP